MTKIDKDNIIKKIQKCFALAESPNENEAAVAADMAQRLLDKYNLTMVDLASFESPSEIITSDVSEKGRHESWTGTLMSGLSKTFDCRGYSSSTGKGRTFKVVGFPTDIEVFTYTYNYLLRVIKGLYTAALKKEKAESSYWSRKDTFAFKSGFCTGCSQRIVTRIKEDRDNRLQANVDSRALVVTKGKTVSTWVDKNLNLKSRTKRYNPTGYTKGVNAANGISLRNAIKASNRMNGAIA